MRFKLEIDLGEIEGLRTGRNLAGILHGLATMMWTATEPLQPIQKYGITDPRFPEKTAGYWQVMPDDEEHIKRATALQSVAPHLSIVEALEATKQKPEPVADVCIAGAPAIDGQCGDRACVCSRYEPPTVEEWHSIDRTEHSQDAAPPLTPLETRTVPVGAFRLTLLGGSRIHT
jgi:hypothetical protein